MKDVLQEKTVTFDTNGGSSVPSQKLYAGQRVIRPSNPNKTNSVFLGWYKDNTTFLQLYDFSYVPYRDMTLYAKWDNSDTETPTPPEPPVDPITPTADNFTISGLGPFTYDGSPKAVTVTVKSDIAGMGTVTVKYGNSTTAPINAGTYIVTFDVDKGTNYTLASSLNAGTLTILRATPTADDFTISNLTQTADNITDVIITPKTGKSNGNITINYHVGNTLTTTLPTTGGNYPVTFDVAEGTNYTLASGLNAGMLIISNPTFNSANAFAEWLSKQSDNNNTTPYTVELEISDTADFAAINIALRSGTNKNKYIILDLSKSTILTIPNYAFQNCHNLTSVTIPNIKDFAFHA